MSPSERGYAVASAHPLATWAGLRTLEDGGNAYDAALAVSATLPVVQPHMNGLGSDFFAVIRDRPSVAINSSGPAAHAATVERFHRKRLASIPKRGPLSSLTVPGLVAAWTYLAARGQSSWKETLAPAIRLAAQGFPASPSLARASRSFGWGDPDFRALFGAIRPGCTLRQPHLAKTLSAIAADKGHGFYHGEMARQICEDLARKGGLLAVEDLDAYRLEVTRPLRIRYRSFVVETNPPPSQGAAALIWLNLLDRVDLARMSEASFVEALCETMKVAYSYRARYIGDPAYLSFPRSLLRKNARYVQPPRSGPRRESSADTTAFSVYDGRVGISAIQSNYGGFGSGVAIRGTGITLSNRGSYFTLDRRHPNALAPGKRTFHTLMALVASGPRTLLLGSMGADVQPQANVQILTRHLDRGDPLQTAVAAPRFAYPASIYGTARWYREPGLPLRSGQVVRGDRSMFGHAQGISVGESTEVGVDPRGDGLLPLLSYARTH